MSLSQRQAKAIKLSALMKKLIALDFLTNGVVFKDLGQKQRAKHKKLQKLYNHFS